MINYINISVFDEKRIFYRFQNLIYIDVKQKESILRYDNEYNIYEYRTGINWNNTY